MKPGAGHPFLIDFLHDLEGGNDVWLPSGGDWAAVAEEAHAQGLTPLLIRWLARSGNLSLLPAETADLLDGRLHAVAARNMMLADELGGMLRALEGADIPCVPLRGLALAEDLFGDITSRPMGDIDVLVRRPDLGGVAEVLSGLGFRQMDRRPGFATRYYYTLKFFKDRHGWVIVEPHWTIAYPPFADRIDMEAVWQRCESGEILGIACRRLTAGDLLLHLCLHMAHEGVGAPLLHLFEIHRLIRQNDGDLDWYAAVSLAEESGQGFLLRGALEEVVGLFGSPVPEEVIGRLPDQPPVSFEGRLVRLLAGVEDIDGRESLALLFTIKGPVAKLRYILELLFPSPEFMMVQYGLSRSGQLVFSYISRVLYFAREGLRGVVRLLF